MSRLVFLLVSLWGLSVSAQPMGGNFGLIKPPLGGVASADLDLDGTYNLILDADGDTKCFSTTDDTLTCNVGGVNTFRVTTGQVWANQLIFPQSAGAGTDVMRMQYDATTAFQIVLQESGSLASNNLVLTEFSNRNDAFTTPDSTNPTLWIYSTTPQASATDEWIKFAHNVTDGVIDAGSGAVNITQSLKLPITNVADGASPYAWTDEDHTIVCDVTTAVTVTLPAVASYTGQVLVVKNDTASGGNCTVDGDGSETIDGATTQALTAGEAIWIQSDGDEWHIL